MKIKITYKCPVGPVESDSTEFTLIKEVSIIEYIKLLNKPNDITKIEII